MRQVTKSWYLVLVASIALFSLAALGAAGDPIDTDSEPTEDWVFDGGNTTTLIGDWTIGYNITITNESIVVIQGSDWVFNSSGSGGPNWIFLDSGELTIMTSDFNASDGSPGYYIETHNITKLSSCTFRGLTAHPISGAGISIYDTNATLEYVTINGTLDSADAVYGENSNLTIVKTNIWDIDGAAITHWVGRNTFNETYMCKMEDCDIREVNYGIFMPTRANYGDAVLDCFNVTIFDSNYGVIIESRENGNGSVYAWFDNMNISHVDEAGFWLQTVYEQTGAVGQNMFHVTFINSSLTNVNSTGFFTEMFYSSVYYKLVIENSVLEDIGVEPAFAFPGGVALRYIGSTGSGDFFAGNSTFLRCSPNAFMNTADTSGLTGIRFFNCSITESDGSALYLETSSSSSSPSTVIENCTISNNKGSAIHHQFNNYATCMPIVIMNTTIAENKDVALRAIGSNSYAATGVGFNITNSVIRDHANYAIEMFSISNGGTNQVVLRDCLITDSGGLFIQLRDYWNDNANVIVILINTTMQHISSDAIVLPGMAYQGGYYAYVTLENSTLKDIAGTGISVSTAEEYDYYTPTFITDVRILNSTIEDLTDNALFLDIQTPENKGYRTYTIVNSSILSCKRGVYAANHDGQVWNSTFSDNLKEDVTSISATADMYYTNFDSITDDKFAVYGFGEINFIFDLVVFVRWDTGTGAVGASVEIMDNTEKLISVQNVKDEDGSLPVYTMNPYWVTPVGIYSESPYVINVEFMDMSHTVGVRLNMNKEVYILLEDHIDPEIVLLYPHTGHVQQSTELEVRGSAWDSQSGVVSVQISLDGTNWMVAKGKWIQWNLTFVVSDELIKQFGGYFVLRTKAIDSAGNEGEAFAVIRVDPTPPELKIDFPMNGYSTNNPELYVRGVTELGSTVKVNGVTAEVVVSMFNHKMKLLEGPNSISIVSIDPLGNIQIETLTVTLDTQEPYLILISPEMDEITNQNEVLVQAQVEEGLTVYINDYPIEYGSDHYPKGEGIIEYSVALEPGENTITITATDKADNSFIVERTVVLDRNQPWISVAAPLDGERLARPEVTVKGTVEPGVQLFVQDENVGTGNGYFERVILAVEGVNEIILKAIDPAGNEYSEVITIFVDTVRPVLTITEPKSDMVITGEHRFYFNGSIALNESGVLTDDRLLLNGYTYTTLVNEEGLKVRVPIEIHEDGTFSIIVDLEQGRNDFTIEVLDRVGNTVRISRTVYLDAIAPTLVLYMDPIMRDDQGEFYTHALTLNLTGYTNPGSELRILDILVSVAPDGTFQINLDLVPKDTTNIVVTSKNSAGNLRTIEESVTQMQVEPTSVDDEGLGTWFLVTALVIFVVVAIIAFMLVRSRREEYIEIKTAEETQLADLETTEHEIDLEGGPDEELEASAAPVAGMARPRPRPSTHKRPARPRPVEPEEPEMTEKDLSDQGAESDIGADEIEQEGN